MMKVLSFEEIEKRYDGEWVLIAYTDLDENLKPIAGEVIAHSIDRDVVYDAIAHRGDSHSGRHCQRGVAMTSGRS